MRKYHRQHPGNFVSAAWFGKCGKTQPLPFSIAKRSDKKERDRTCVRSLLWRALAGKGVNRACRKIAERLSRQIALHRELHQSRDIMNFEFSHQTRSIGVHCFRAQRKPRGDLFRTDSLYQE
jgi:hypothetical protein